MLHIWYFIQGSHYAILAVSDNSKCKAPENDPSKVVYSNIDTKNQVTQTKKDSIKQSAPVQQSES